MEYKEAVEFREKNMHLVGMEFKGSKIGGVFIYPREPKFWNEFIHQFAYRKGEPVHTASAFPSNDFGLRIYLALEFPTYIFHHELSELPEEYKVVLPDNY